MSNVTSYEITREDAAVSVVDRGNLAPLCGVFEKARQGERITVAFLGGSITQGCLASVHENCYAARVHAWLSRTFPQAEVRYVNAGVGATGSLIGAHRLGAHVLAEHPDLVFVEFAVNDRENEIDPISYESIIVRLLSEPDPPAVIELFLGCEDGHNVQAQMIRIGSHYSLPMISYRDAVFPELNRGTFEWQDISPDDTHPNDLGHDILAQLICSFLESALRDGSGGALPAVLPRTRVYGDCFRDGVILSGAELIPLSPGSFRPCPEGFQRFRNGWISTPGTGAEPFRAELEGKNIFLLYKKGISPEYGSARATVTGEKPVTIDARFPGGWGDYSETALLLHGSAKKHVMVELQKQEENSLFIILGFLVS